MKTQSLSDRMAARLLGGKAAILLTALILGVPVMGVQAPKQKALCTVLAVEEAPGAWSGFIEVDQWILVRVAQSTDNRFKSGKEYRIGVAVAPGPLFEKDSPRFDSSVVAVGKRLSIVLTEKCVRETKTTASFKIGAECITPSHRSPGF